MDRLETFLLQEKSSIKIEDSFICLCSGSSFLFSLQPAGEKDCRFRERSVIRFLTDRSQWNCRMYGYHQHNWEAYRSIFFSGICPAYNPRRCSAISGRDYFHPDRTAVAAVFDRSPDHGRQSRNQSQKIEKRRAHFTASKNLKNHCRRKLPLQSCRAPAL